MKTYPCILAACFAAIAIAHFPLHAQPTDLRHGLVAFWGLEENEGGTAPDASPLLNHLSIVGAPTVSAGNRGNAFTFDGLSTYLTRTHSADNETTGMPVYRAGRYTVAMWVKGPPQTANYLFSHGNSGNNTPIVILQSGQAPTNNAKFDVILRNDANLVLVNHAVSTNVVFDNTWHHIAWVDDHGNARLYIDGVPDPANFSYTPAGTFTLNNTVVGSLVRTTVATANIFEGQIDELAVWERPLTQAEVIDVMNNGLTQPIPASPPFINRQPTNIVTSVGDRVTLSVTAAGHRPFNYQWMSNGVPVPGAVAASLTLSNLVVADSADYVVQISNSEGSVTSAVATVTVVPDPPVDLRAGLVSYWPLNNIIDEFPLLRTPDVYSARDLRLVNMTAVNEVFGQVNNALAFDGVSQYAVRAGGGAPIYDNPAYSIAFWINTAGTPQTNRHLFSESSTNNDTPLFVLGTHATGQNNTLRVFVRSSANVVLLDRASAGAPLDGTWHHVVWTETNGRGKLYLDGRLDPTSFSYTRAPLALNHSAIGATVRTAISGYLAGTMDELGVWNRALSQTEIQEIVTTGIPEPVGGVPPTFSQEPASRAVLTRTSVNFTYAAYGTVPILAQWRKNGEPLTDATNTTFNIPSAALADAGNYDVVLANPAGSITSRVATLTVALRPPSPARLSIDFNNTDDLSAASTEPGFEPLTIPAIGTGPYFYSVNGVDLTVQGAGVTLESRLRPTPTNSGAFTEERLLRDFIFARDTTPATGLDVTLEFLEPGIPYQMTLWSFDSGSTGTRTSDWIVNGTPARTGYSFSGGTLPVDNQSARITFDVTPDPDGKIVVQGRRGTGTVGPINVFLNALQLVRRDLRIAGVAYLEANFEIELTLEVRDPLANHRIEYKNRLADAEWIEEPLPFFLPPEGNILRVIVSAPDSNTRFYRVVQDPPL